eukprot:2179645-Prymnesium_polylepis.1
MRYTSAHGPKAYGAPKGGTRALRGSAGGCLWHEIYMYAKASFPPFPVKSRPPRGARAPAWHTTISAEARLGWESAVPVYFVKRPVTLDQDCVRTKTIQKKSCMADLISMTS